MPIFQISHGQSIIGAKDHLCNTTIFTIRIEWYEPIITCLNKGYLVDNIPKKRKESNPNHIHYMMDNYMRHFNTIFIIYKSGKGYKQDTMNQ
jgi:hypothetical protein